MSTVNTLNFIEATKAKLPDFKRRSINEAQTKEWLIKPLLETMGWRFSDPDDVVPEDDDSTGKKPDFSFRADGKTKFLLEAKRLGDSLEDPKMISEKLNYCSNSGVPFLLITNGEIYKVYYTRFGGGGKDRLLKEFNIFEQYDDAIVDMLSKEAFRTERLLAYAKRMFVDTTVKRALDGLLQRPPRQMVALLNTAIKDELGHKFGDDEIKGALKNLSVHVNTEPEEQVVGGENGEGEQEDRKWTVDHQFKSGRWNSSRQLYGSLVSEARRMGLSFEEKPTKFYVGWVSNDVNFCQIHGQKSGLKIWVVLAMSDLSQEDKQRVLDVSAIGHWGMGNLEFVVSTTEDIDWAVNLLKKAALRPAKQ